MVFINSIKKCRESKGFTQKEVALSLHVTIQAVSYWETGERMPSYEKLIMLADLLETSTDELLGRQSIQGQTVRHSAQEKRLLAAARDLNDAGMEELARYAGLLSGNPLFTEKRAASFAG